MKIVGAEVFMTCPGCNFITLKMMTDDGGVGPGLSFGEKRAAKPPHKPTCLPVARLEDGTLWNG